jgi:uncharacterized protein (DUF302 family)
MMIEQITVDHVTIATKRSFDEVVSTFESLVGNAEQNGLSWIADNATDKADFEKRVTATLGSSGLTRFITFDHGQWAAFEGHPHKMRMYVIGNPLIAITMIRHDIGAGLDVPVRIAIYETAGSETRFVYNKPSTLMSCLKNPALHEAALKLDAKLLALAESSTGAKANA